MNKIINIFVLVLGILLFFGGCYKQYDMKACFTTEKNTYSLGETIEFTDCSEIQKHKNSDNATIFWDFGDGNTTYETIGKSVFHSYDSIGTYHVSIQLGNPEQLSIAEKEIVIIQ